ncbi:MAG TPA: glycosyltransferase [Steroidobacteraceae bacterium]|nr:glycosyltransferase [Steroidobacteraceae bacterium]
MRVLLISDVYFPRVNGVSTSIRTFRQDLASVGVATRLVAPRYAPTGAPAPDGGDGLPDEQGVLRVPAKRVPLDPEDRRMAWRALTRTLDELPAGEFDLVHIQTPFVAHYAGVRCARRARVPCVATYHTFFEEYLHHYVPVLPRPVSRLLARSFTRSQCAAVQALIAPSEPMREVLTAYGVTTPIHVLPTGLAPDRFRPGDGRAFRTRAGIDPDRPLIIHVGRVAHEKNIGFLIEVFAELLRSVPSALLVIAGEGPAREALRAQVRSLGLERHVHLAGYLERDSALLDCYAAADVFVFASRTETQGLVLLEAMAQGAPVVSTAELGTRSILVPASGALVVPEERATFAAAVARVLGDARLRRQLSEQGRAYARTWSSAAMARRLAQIYGELRGVASCAPGARDVLSRPRRVS